MLETSDVLILARLQFAFTISTHIIFPAISIGLASARWYVCSKQTRSTLAMSGRRCARRFCACARLRIACQKSGSHDAAAPIWFEASWFRPTAGLVRNKLYADRLFSDTSACALTCG